MARALKVFRTAAGFNDAYVAAPSRKAALQAWGTDADLFARGAAEQVTDEALMAEPLKRPGEVILRSRGGLAEQLKALGPKTGGGKAKRARQSQAADTPEAEAPPTRKPATKPPRRDRLDRAEAAVEDANARHAAAKRELEAEREAIERKIADLEARQAKELVKLERQEREARDAYREALARWSG